MQTNFICISETLSTVPSVGSPLQCNISLFFDTVIEGGAESEKKTRRDVCVCDRIIIVVQRNVIRIT